MTEILQTNSFQKGELKISTLLCCGHCWWYFVRVLNVSWCRGLQDTALVELFNQCTDLSFLDVSLCMNITDEAFENVQSNQLQGFVAAKCVQLSDKTAVQLARCKNLEFLNVTEWQVRKNCWERLSCYPISTFIESNLFFYRHCS